MSFMQAKENKSQKNKFLIISNEAQADCQNALDSVRAASYVMQANKSGVLTLTIEDKEHALKHVLHKANRLDVPLVLMHDPGIKPIRGIKFEKLSLTHISEDVESDALVFKAEYTFGHSEFIDEPECVQHLDKFVAIKKNKETDIT